MSETPKDVMLGPEVIEQGESGSYGGVVYWRTDIFAEHPPYRKIVKWIIEELQLRYRVEVVAEPEEIEGEDFVVHDLQVDGRKMQIYWENALGYVQFSSQDGDLLREICGFLQGKQPEYEGA